MSSATLKGCLYAQETSKDSCPHRESVSKRGQKCAPIAATAKSGSGTGQPHAPSGAIYSVVVSPCPFFNACTIA